MNPEISKEIQDQIASLPKKVRDIIASIDITNEIASLRDKHHLMLDQVSTLELETMLVMIGLEEAENFVNILKSNLNLDEEKAEALAIDINELIFNKIRHAMMEEDKGEEGEKEEILNKDSILWEIENPKPTAQAITPIPKPEVKTEITPKIQGISPEIAPKIQSNLPEIAPTQTLEKYTAPIPTKTFLEKKLSEPTHIAPKETEISLKKIPQVLNNSISQTLKPTVDPYKEPIE